jgi:FkbM family methyltransferase
MKDTVQNREVHGGKGLEMTHAEPVWPPLHEHNRPKQHYSQFGQDMLVGDILFRTRPGIFVDVGALDGRMISNTLYLEQIGWTGLCIEPLPESYEQLTQNRSCRCINVAAGRDYGTLDFARHANPGQSGLLETWRDPSVPHEVIQVPVVPLSDLIADLPVVHYLDIDVEGHELEVLRGINFRQTEFRIISVETGENRGAINDFLDAQGYRPFLDLRADRFYCKKGDRLPEGDLSTNRLLSLP